MEEYLKTRDFLAQTIGYLIGRFIVEAEGLAMKSGGQEAAELFMQITRAASERADTGEAGTLKGWPALTARLVRVGKHLEKANKVLA